MRRGPALPSVDHGAGGGKASFFQNKLKDNDLTIINITDSFAHIYVGTYWESDGKWHGVQSRVNRTDGCTTKMRTIVTASSGDVVSDWAKALDSHCDLSRGQTFTDTVTRIQ